MNLFEYEVEIEEVLQRVVKVKATSEDEAIRKVKEQYVKAEIVLDAEDFIDYEIRPYKK